MTRQGLRRKVRSRVAWIRTDALNSESGSLILEVVDGPPKGTADKAEASPGYPTPN